MAAYRRRSGRARTGAADRRALPESSLVTAEAVRGWCNCYAEHSSGTAWIREMTLAGALVSSEARAPFFALSASWNRGKRSKISRLERWAPRSAHLVNALFIDTQSPPHGSHLDCLQHVLSWLRFAARYQRCSRAHSLAARHTHPTPSRHDHDARPNATTENRGAVRAMPAAAWRQPAVGGQRELWVRGRACRLSGRASEICRPWQPDRVSPRLVKLFRCLDGEGAIYELTRWVFSALIPLGDGAYVRFFASEFVA